MQSAAHARAGLLKKERTTQRDGTRTRERPEDPEDDAPASYADGVAFGDVGLRGFGANRLF
jgi:hypothetical protein